MMTYCGKQDRSIGQQRGETPPSNRLMADPHPPSGIPREES